MRERNKRSRFAKVLSVMPSTAGILNELCFLLILERGIKNYLKVHQNLLIT